MTLDLFTFTKEIFMGKFQFLCSREAVPEGVPKKFVKFTGKYLCRSFFFNKGMITLLYFIKKKTPVAAPCLFL